MNGLSGWHSITFTGTYAGLLLGKYNNMIAIISYQGLGSGSGNYEITLNIRTRYAIYSALRDSGYLQINDYTLQIIGATSWTVGELVFPVKL